MNQKYIELMEEFQQAKSEQDERKKTGALHQATVSLSKVYLDAIDSAGLGNIDDLVYLYSSSLGKLISVMRNNKKRKERYFPDIPQKIANKAIVQFLSFPYRSPEYALTVLECSERNVVCTTPGKIERIVFVYYKEGLGRKEGLLRKVFAESKAF